ncbi:hypothetical protein [Hymenobacter sp. UYCo722]|uniref:hypothetical protein n=1 Tax=Hymenobacter sp. UYCo722 TaxID=3156335 RepID=UPI00339AD990
MKKGNVTLAASRENLQRLQLLAAQHLIDTGEKRNLVQMLDLVITSYCLTSIR